MLRRGNAANQIYHDVAERRLGLPSHDKRRFAVFNVSDARRKDRAYFEALVEEIETGGTEAFFADMLAMELGDWHPRNDVPETEGLAMQKQESANLRSGDETRVYRVLGRFAAAAPLRHHAFCDAHGRNRNLRRAVGGAFALVNRIGLS